MSKRLYVVTLVHEVVVLADCDQNAEVIARKAMREQPGDCGEADCEQVVPVTMPEQIPHGWGIPFGAERDDNWQAYMTRSKP